MFNLQQPTIVTPKIADPPPSINKPHKVIVPKVPIPPKPKAETYLDWLYKAVEHFKKYEENEAFECSRTGMKIAIKQLKPDKADIAFSVLYSQCGETADDWGDRRQKLCDMYADLLQAVKQIAHAAVYREEANRLKAIGTITYFEIAPNLAGKQYHSPSLGGIRETGLLEINDDQDADFYLNVTIPAHMVVIKRNGSRYVAKFRVTVQGTAKTIEYELAKRNGKIVLLHNYDKQFPINLEETK